MSKVLKVVKEENGTHFAIMDLVSKLVLLTGLGREDLMSIMEGCSKWLDAIEGEP